jgi:hypothetical protein
MQKDIDMKKMIIVGNKERDPGWIKDIASYLESEEERGGDDRYKKQLRELFLEYKRDGLKHRDAWEKAKRVLASFEFEK